MYINKQNNSNTQFKGIPIAKINSKGANPITLYKLGKEDITFGKTLADTLNLKALHPTEENYNGFTEWLNIIIRATKDIGRQPVVLAVQNNRPCGIISYRTTNNNVSLISALATWPGKINQPAKHVGKALMRNLFQYTHENKNILIELKPASCKPRNKSCKVFYSKLGFKESPMKSDDNIFLELKNVNFNSKCAQMENFFEYQEIKNAKNENLNSKLTFKITDTFSEKLTKLFSKKQ